jgi:hypothetical protein
MVTEDHSTGSIARILYWENSQKKHQSYIYSFEITLPVDRPVYPTYYPEPQQWATAWATAMVKSLSNSI